MYKDIASNLDVDLVENLAISSNTTTVSNSIDTKDMENGSFIAVLCSAYTDGDYVVTLEDSPDDSVWTALDSDQYNGGATTFTISAATAAAGTLNKLGFFSTDRYVRATITSTSVTTGATLNVMNVHTAEVLPI